MRTPHQPSVWPPELPEGELRELAEQSVLYALGHGLMFLPPPSSTVQTGNTGIGQHAPFSLFPSLFPRRLFDQAKRLQHTYNVLYARIAMDAAFLDGVMGEVGVGKVDTFMGGLWRIWKDHREEGIVQVLQLGIFRSDYLVHATPGDLSRTSSLKQVEFNTIAASGGVHSKMVSDMHRFMHQATRYSGSSAGFDIKDFAVNGSRAGVAEGLAAAHKAYGVEGAQVLFVVQPGERNVFDQRGLEYELIEEHGIPVVRQTFAELTDSIQLKSSTRRLFLNLYPDKRNARAVEISVVYFRTGYSPLDFGYLQSWDVRRSLERSMAIKCPPIPLQLAGSKKVQQVLTQPGVLERFLCDTDKWGPEYAATKGEIDEIRGSWMEMWALDDDTVTLNEEGERSAHLSNAVCVNGFHPERLGRGEGRGMRKARACASSLVLKPQREGGGNNVYRTVIPSFLDGLRKSECAAWIAMALITPPERQMCYFIRPVASKEERLGKVEVANELGIFGWTLFGEGRVRDEREVGWLVRTKRVDSDEGGMSVGCSVLDSLILAD